MMMKKRVRHHARRKVSGKEPCFHPDAERLRATETNTDSLGNNLQRVGAPRALFVFRFFTRRPARAAFETFRPGSSRKIRSRVQASPRPPFTLGETTPAQRCDKFLLKSELPIDRTQFFFPGKLSGQPTTPYPDHSCLLLTEKQPMATRRSHYRRAILSGMRPTVSWSNARRCSAGFAVTFRRPFARHSRECIAGTFLHRRCHDAGHPRTHGPKNCRKPLTKPYSNTSHMRNFTSCNSEDDHYVACGSHS
jgi:hypothetical protein